MDNHQLEQPAQKAITQYLTRHWQLHRTSWHQDDPSVLKSIFQALQINPGDHFILSPFAHQACIDTLSDLGANLIFIDLSEKDGQLDTDILEHFLSLSTILNEQNELLYRKDEAPIRGILLTQLADHFGAIESLQFISQRYHLPIVEDFSEALGLSSINGHHSGTLGAISFARLSQSIISLDAGILVNIPVTPPKLNLSGFEIVDPGAFFLQNPPPANPPNQARTLLNLLKETGEKWEHQAEITNKIAKKLEPLTSLQRWNPYSNYRPIFLAKQGVALRKELEEHFLEKRMDWFSRRKVILSKNIYLQPRKIFQSYLESGLAFSTKKMSEASVNRLPKDIENFYQSFPK